MFQPSIYGKIILDKQLHIESEVIHVEIPYIYEQLDGEVKILTPDVNLSEVKHEVLEQTSNCIKNRLTYPNGFVIETDVYSDRIVRRTNRPLIDNGDGTFSIGG